MFRRLLIIALFATLLACRERALGQVALGRITVQQPTNPANPGTAQVTVNGTTKIVSYGSFSTPASVASALAAAFSRDCLSTVLAKATGATVAFYPREAWLNVFGLLPLPVISDSGLPGQASFSIVASTPASASSVQLAASPSTAAAGAVVSLTAVVSPSIATGSLTFMDGANTIGIVPLSGASASLATQSIPSGTHQITAIYSGDGTYANSTSNAAQVIVQGDNQTSGLQISGISPDMAPSGAAPISIVGSGFTNTAGVVLLNGTPVAPTGMLSWSNTIITFQIPPAAVAGVVQVVVQVSPGSQSNEVPFTVLPTLPCPVFY